MAHFLHHTGCDNCGSSDALAHYSDGGLYCFSCGWTGKPTKPSFKEMEDDEDFPSPPDDLTHDFPSYVGEWLAPTELTYGDLIANGCFYSRSAGGLVRLFDILPTVSGNRYLGNRRRSWDVRFQNQRPKGPKTKFYGTKEEVFPIVAAKDANLECLVLVEDSLSSIKVGKVVPCMALLGSTISKNKLLKTIDILKCQEILVWLDADKWTKSQEIASLARSLGVRSRCIYSDDDPKYQTLPKIKELLCLSV